MVDFDKLTMTISLVILFLSLIYIKKKKRVTNVYLIFFSIFFIYLIGVLKYTIFPIPLDPFMREVMSRETTFLNGVNLIPFNFKSMEYLLHNQILLNIILSIPFGFGISYITKISKKKLLSYGIFFGVIIELTQLIISLILGYTYRYIDINDVILNFVGVIIGYFIFKAFAMIFIKIVEKFNIKLDSILEYIYNISKYSIEKN
ncbi:VanZ family protein [Clostridium sp. D2Q-11]|uniref:VanZ family protein n=1 Tax=Anaeromonas frigoriresistens TaxID=2683708 RepID=A0A942UVJ9_9FIRM|nr:VanZ family protein [Anaeromonas frigoriresistens]MBS4539383.1 VanZ family protein [Anaeromonas frigoriresistens]